jgi:hypothetical protein
MAVATRAGSAVSSEKVKRPALTAGAAAVGLAGGIVLGSRMSTGRRRKVLGVPLGRRSNLRTTVEMLGKAAHGLGSATRHVSSTTDDIHQVREELERANRQSPVEVLLNALTHRRGAHKQET